MALPVTPTALAGCSLFCTDFLPKRGVILVLLLLAVETRAVRCGARAVTALGGPSGIGSDFDASFEGVFEEGAFAVRRLFFSSSSFGPGLEIGST